MQSRNVQISVKNLVSKIDSLTLILVNHQTTPHFKLLPMSKVDRTSPIYAIVRCRLFSNQKVK